MDALVSTLFLGAVFGSIYALLAFGLVLTYRTSGVFNFAQGALGMFFAFVFFQLHEGGRLNLVAGVWDVHRRLPMAAALVIVVGLVAPATGAALDVVLFRKLRDAGAAVQIVATIGLLISLQGAAGVIWGAGSTLTPRSLFGEHVFQPRPQLRIPAGQVGTVLVVVALAAGLVVLLRRSLLGARMRAVVDRPELAALMGIDTGRVSALAWALGSAFAALAGILIAPFYGSLDTLTLTFLVVAATTAAVVGRLSSIPLTLAGGLAVGVLQLLTQRYVHGELGRELRPAIPFIVLFCVLLLPVSWPGTSAVVRGRGPRERGVRAPFGRRVARVAPLVGALVLAPFLPGGLAGTVLGGDWQRQLTLVPPMALVFLSLVVLVGYAGQISLCQGALAGVSAFVAARLVSDAGLPFVVGVGAGAAVSLLLGVVLAWRATQLPPLFLGFASLALGAAIDEVLFTNPRFSNGLAGIALPRPSLLAGDRAYYLFGLAVFLLAALFVANLRRGRIGLALAAMRDSPVALAGVGTGIARLKLISFCLSAVLAGLGGALFAGARGLAISTDWFKVVSLLVLALAVVGGIGRWPGALAGAALYQLAAPVLHQPVFRENIVFKTLFGGQLESLLPVLFGLGAIGLAQNPDGLVEQVRDGLARARAVLARGGPALASAPAAGAAEPSPDCDAVVVVRNGALFHRAGCLLVRNKDGASPATPGRLRRRRPCPVCEPPRVRGEAGRHGRPKGG